MDTPTRSSKPQTENSKVNTQAIGSEVNFNTYADTSEYYSMDSKDVSPEKMSSYKTNNIAQTPDIEISDSNNDTLDVNTNKRQILNQLNPNQNEKIDLPLLERKYTDPDGHYALFNDPGFDIIKEKTKKKRKSNPIEKRANIPRHAKKSSKSNVEELIRKPKNSFKKKNQKSTNENLKTDSSKGRTITLKTEEDLYPEPKSYKKINQNNIGIKNSDIYMQNKAEEPILVSENITSPNQVMDGKYLQKEENFKVKKRKSLKGKTEEIKHKKKNPENRGFVNKNSEKLLKNLRPQNVPVEEILLSKAEISEMKKWKLKEFLKSSHQPQICPKSRNIGKNRDKREVFDRLYQDSVRLNYLRQINQQSHNYQQHSSKNSYTNEQLEIDLLNIPYKGSDREVKGITENNLYLDNENHRNSAQLNSPNSDAMMMNNLVQNLGTLTGSYKNLSGFSNSKKRSMDTEHYYSYDQYQQDNLHNNQQVEPNTQIYDRGLAFLHKKDMKVQQMKDEIDEKKLEECFFMPDVKDYYPKSEPKKESRFKIVVNGNTYDLASETDLHNFFLSSIAKKGLKRNNFNQMYGSTSSLGKFDSAQKYYNNNNGENDFNPMDANYQDNLEDSCANESQSIGKKSIFQKNIDNLNMQYSSVLGTDKKNWNVTRSENDGVEYLNQLGRMSDANMAM